jgi:hypothetical protein
MKIHKFDKNSFVAGYYISENICDNLIKRYKEEDLNNNTFVGTTDSAVKKIKHTKGKKSTEYTTSVNDNDPRIIAYVECLKKLVGLYNKTYPTTTQISKYGLVERFNIQYYKPTEGFYEWHCESSGIYPNSARVFAWMTYLNDVPNGGTDFLYQNLTVPAKKGLTLMWPAGWTHTHKGQISNEYEKYIITGWFSYTDKNLFRGLDNE